MPRLAITMVSVITPKLVRRGLELFALISIVGFVGMLLYGNNLDHFLHAMFSLRWRWVLVGVCLASMDWFGGGLRLYVFARHLHPDASLKGCVLAGGLTAFAGYVTPAQSGSGPMMIYTLNRYGLPLPQAVITGLMTLIATVLFFSVAGPTAVFLGAGSSLGDHGVLAGVSLNDLFRASLGGFVSIGLVMLLFIVFPGVARRIARRLASMFERRGNEKFANRVEVVREGIDRAHESLVAFFHVRGWLALAGGVGLTGLAFSNRLLSGYVVLRMLGIHAPFVDVLLLQTFIVFMLYFAPTPGGSGIAELLSAAVMSIYVPRELTPSYILLWRIVVSYMTVGFGSFVFWNWLKGAETSAEEGPRDPEEPHD
jgi:uncharacterized protein (TIRG00374 family)